MSAIEGGRPPLGLKQPATCEVPETQLQGMPYGRGEARRSAAADKFRGDIVEQKQDLMASSKLEVIHMRGYCVPIKRAILDASHLAGPFRDRTGFRVLLDHGYRLRKVCELRLGTKSGVLTTATEEERAALSADLYRY